MVTFDELDDAITEDIIDPVVSIKKWKGSCLHHSYKPTVPNYDYNYAKIFNRIHYNENGWKNGCGYHFVISWDNENVKIWSTYRWIHQIDGAHALNPKGVQWADDLQKIRPNQELVGICIVGDFDKQVLLPHVSSFLANNVIHYLYQKYSIPKAMFFHHDFDYKTCPGQTFLDGKGLGEQ